MAKKPMMQLPGLPHWGRVLATHPSHRSLLRKVTCIKDGFFYAPSLLLGSDTGETVGVGG
jgi:hypothetical protein